MSGVWRLPSGAATLAFALALAGCALTRPPEPPALEPPAPVADEEEVEPERAVVATPLPRLEPRHALSPVGEIDRKGCPVDLSSICRVADGRYLAASDSGGKVCELAVSCDPVTGRIVSFRAKDAFVLEGGVDIEGLAYDPLNRLVWAADESSNSVTSHDPADGRRTGRLILPGTLVGRFRSNRGLESLTIREDGLEMWTCNEDTLIGDGTPSSREKGAMVRLTRFTRPDATSAWRSDGQWAYRTGKVRGGQFRGVAMSGVSALCALPDGTLLVLEREMSRTLLPTFRCTVTEIDREGATDVTGRGALTDGDIVPVRKARLFRQVTGFCNYEGMCLGEPLADGSRALLLVSDGDDSTPERIFAFRISPSIPPPDSQLN